MSHKTILIAFILATAAGIQAAVPTGAGPYSLSDYFSGSSLRIDARPETALTADQTWVVGAAQNAKPFYPGQQVINDFWQIWTGESVTSVSGTGFRVMKGNVVFENAVISKTTENYIGYTGDVKLKLRNGGSFYADADHVRVGNPYNSGTAGTATVFMEEPSSFGVNGKWAAIGNNLPGALWMDGGLFAMTNEAFYVGNHESYVRLNGGKLSLRAENAETLQVGSGSGYASMHISGGEMTSRRTSYAGETYSRIGPSSSKGGAELYMDAGKVNMPNERFLLGQSSTAGTSASLTVDGSAEFNVALFVMGRTSTAIDTFLNLNGGTFKTTKGLSTYGSTGPSRRVNLDGGTIVGLMDAAWPTTVYPKGATIDVASGSVNVKLDMKSATGFGVTAITLTNPGSGYVTAPKVTISGGSGHGATGYAVMNRDRTVEKVVVTCRGEGYRADDVLTVAFASSTGSGAEATVTLGENTKGTIRKTGAGVWQRNAGLAFDGDVSVEAGGLALDGADVTGLNGLYVKDGAWLAAGRSLDATTVRESSVNRIDARNALARIATYGESGRAKLTIGEINADTGLVVVSKTNSLDLAVTETASSATSSTVSPVVNGLVYAHGDSTGYRSPSLFERAADGTLSLVTTTAVPGPDANYCPSAGNSAATAPEVSALNSVILPLTPGVECYVKSSGLVDIKSGMIVCRRPHECVERVAVTGGGAFTTRAKGGMFIYADQYQTAKRSNSSANSSVVACGNWRRIYGPFADPDASTPMVLTIAGERKERPELGAVAWLLDVNTFSGGLNLVNGGVFVDGDSHLGKLGAPINVAGYCSIAARNWTFSIGARPVTIASDSALQFSPAYGNQGNTVAATFKGTGDLLTSDICRSGYAIAYTGDHSAFEGQYYVMGHARIAPETFGPQARIFLADGEGGTGVIETHGAITRPLSLMEPGALCWHRHRSMPAAYGLRGGFAAYGGDLTVNLGGQGELLPVASDALPEGARIMLQSQYADGKLTFANGFALGGKTQTMTVWTGKTATLTGTVADAVGGGRLDVTGNLAFAGTLELAEKTLQAAAPLLTVDGKLDLTGAKVDVKVDAEALKAACGTDIALASATGTVTGLPTLVESPAGNWKLKVKDGQLLLSESKGLSLIIR